MIQTLYENYRHWSDGRSVYILSDPHFDDAIGKDMVDVWLEADELVDKINRTRMKKEIGLGLLAIMARLELLMCLKRSGGDMLRRHLNQVQ
ncbi:hypothetical protein [Butyrivibrio sp. MB2005]|uniref:hypothetical protein n=1 Tax=Butyrivibrio sp. MB2005 TaxID=1280678 RepID=UPI00047EC62E|nr:hypothetical protein [Butyrivibrio sp. MB2005]